MWSYVVTLCLLQELMVVQSVSGLNNYDNMGRKAIWTGQIITYASHLQPAERTTLTLEDLNDRRTTPAQSKSRKRKAINSEDTEGPLKKVPTTEAPVINDRWRYDLTIAPTTRDPLQELMTRDFVTAHFGQVTRLEFDEGHWNHGMPFLATDAQWYNGMSLYVAVLPSLEMSRSYAGRLEPDTPRTALRVGSAVYSQMEPELEPRALNRIYRSAETDIRGTCKLLSSISDRPPFRLRGEDRRNLLASLGNKKNEQRLQRNTG
ncbi:hypothetical protein PROFUN_00676 [Planoprotostelium fungivorum]|uniref:Uncharacterized protein n=1 Tax=Planoprotostelium fungivorum TaxID=1890364 RepID=A0A2P6NU10_9EUKA|nr:hypothetical protein PROFUN_00676 [Planoprotostelium fungivorum]